MKSQLIDHEFDRVQFRPFSIAERRRAYQRALLLQQLIATAILASILITLACFIF